MILLTNDFTGYKDDWQDDAIFVIFLVSSSFMTLEN